MRMRWLMTMVRQIMMVRYDHDPDSTIMIQIPQLIIIELYSFLEQTNENIICG
jgi:hypothetical protein